MEFYSGRPVKKFGSLRPIRQVADEGGVPCQAENCRLCLTGEEFDELWSDFSAKINEGGWGGDEREGGGGGEEGQCRYRGGGENKTRRGGNEEIERIK